jgi:hypothetical protein
LFIAAVKDKDLLQFDIYTTFLHGDLEEEIYMEQQPKGFEETRKSCLRSNLVYWLLKNIYGLK